MKRASFRTLCFALFCCLLTSSGFGLQSALGVESTKVVTVHNYGVPGANSRETLARLPKYLAERPEHVVVFLGTNDAFWTVKLVAPKQFQKNLRAIVEKTRKSGAKSILLLTIHPVNTQYLVERHPKHPQRSRLQEHLDEYNVAIREVAKQTGATLVEWRNRFLTESRSDGDAIEEAVQDREASLLRCVANSGARDGVHLTANGYRLLADEVAKALRDRVRPGETVACIGDSLTYGSHMKGAGGVQGDTYPAFLLADLSQSLAARNGDASAATTAPAPRKLPEAPPGWILEVELPDGQTQRIASTDNALKPSETPGEQVGETVWTWNGLGAGPLAKLTVHMTGRERNDEAAHWRLDVENSGQVALRNITFPILEFAVSEDDQIVIPSVSGRLHPGSRPLTFRDDYPSGRLSMQCSGLYGPAGGIYAAMHDPYGSAKHLELNSRGGRLTLKWHWPAPNTGVPGGQWRTPGEFSMRLFDGDWYDLARIYRAWAAKKALWWPRGRQAGRPDTPDWFKDNAVWLEIGGPWRDPPIPFKDTVQQAKRFAEFMGDVPCAAHWYNWHDNKYDDDLPHYFPAKPGFAKGIRELQAVGLEVMPYLNAHVWDKDLDDFKSTAYPWACKSRDESVPIKSYGGNSFAQMCPATRFWQDKVAEMTLRLIGPEYNANGAYLDQVSAQPPTPCFDKSHGHPLGGGHWWTKEGNWELLDRLHARLDQVKPGAILTSESASEPYVSRLDGYLTWVGYRDGSDAIPLFHAIYAGQVQLFGRLYKWDSWKGVAMRMKTAQALVWGEQLGWIRVDVIDDPVAGPFLRRLGRLRSSLSRYLARGQMARPPAIETDGATLTANWVYVRDLMVTTPAVFSGAWRRDDGKAVALIFVNADDKPHTIHVPFDAKTYGLQGRLTARDWTGEETGGARPETRTVAASWRRSVKLAPTASLAIEIETRD